MVVSLFKEDRDTLTVGKEKDQMQSQFPNLPLLGLTVLLLAPALAYLQQHSAILLLISS